MAPMKDDGEEEEEKTEEKEKETEKPKEKKEERNYDDESEEEAETAEDTTEEETAEEQEKRVQGKYDKPAPTQTELALLERAKKHKAHKENSIVHNEPPAVHKETTVIHKENPIDPDPVDIEMKNEPPQETKTQADQKERTSAIEKARSKKEEEAIKTRKERISLARKKYTEKQEREHLEQELYEKSDEADKEKSQKTALAEEIIRSRNRRQTTKKTYFYPEPTVSGSSSDDVYRAHGTVFNPPRSVSEGVDMDTSSEIAQKNKADMIIDNNFNASYYNGSNPNYNADRDQLTSIVAQFTGDMILALPQDKQTFVRNLTRFLKTDNSFFSFLDQSSGLNHQVKSGQVRKLSEPARIASNILRGIYGSDRASNTKQAIYEDYTYHYYITKRELIAKEKSTVMHQIEAQLHNKQITDTMKNKIKDRYRKLIDEYHSQLEPDARFVGSDDIMRDQTYKQAMEDFKTSIQRLKTISSDALKSLNTTPLATTLKFLDKEQERLQSVKKKQRAFNAAIGQLNLEDEETRLILNSLSKNNDGTRQTSHKANEIADNFRRVRDSIQTNIDSIAEGDLNMIETAELLEQIERDTETISSRYKNIKELKTEAHFPEIMSSNHPSKPTLEMDGTLNTRAFIAHLNSRRDGRPSRADVDKITSFLDKMLVESDRGVYTFKEKEPHKLFTDITETNTVNVSDYLTSQTVAPADLQDRMNKFNQAIQKLKSKSDSNHRALFNSDFDEFLDQIPASIDPTKYTRKPQNPTRAKMLEYLRKVGNERASAAYEDHVRGLITHEMTRVRNKLITMSQYYKDPEENKIIKEGLDVFKNVEDSVARAKQTNTTEFSVESQSFNETALDRAKKIADEAFEFAQRIDTKIPELIQKHREEKQKIASDLIEKDEANKRTWTIVKDRLLDNDFSRQDISQIQKSNANYVDVIEAVNHANSMIPEILGRKMRRFNNKIDSEFSHSLNGDDIYDLQNQFSLKAEQVINDMMKRFIVDKFDQKKGSKPEEDFMMYMDGFDIDDALFKSMKELKSEKTTKDIDAPMEDATRVEPVITQEKMNDIPTETKTEIDESEAMEETTSEAVTESLKTQINEKTNNVSDKQKDRIEKKIKELQYEARDQNAIADIIKNYNTAEILRSYREDFFDALLKAGYREANNKPVIDESFTRERKATSILRKPPVQKDLTKKAKISRVPDAKERADRAQRVYEFVKNKKIKADSDIQEFLRKNKNLYIDTVIDTYDRNEDRHTEAFFERIKGDVVHYIMDKHEDEFFSKLLQEKTKPPKKSK
tara:strand:- start:304 stop:4149 length:3846 start_codon:yes stop_codon:yes gene_type:complete